MGIIMLGGEKMKRKILAVLLAFVCLATVLTACTDNKNNDNATAGSEGQNLTENSVQASANIELTTEAPAIPQDAKLIALTYDDGPYTKTTSRILDVLRKNNSVATFFIIGNRAEKYASVLKQAIDMGCEIGNHTYEHKNLVKADENTRRTQIEKTNNEIQKLFGYDIKLLRAPEGAIKGIKDKVGMPLIQWSVDTEDWKHKDASNPGRSEAQRQEKINSIVDKVVNNAQPGDVILMHDIYDFTADLSEKLVPALVEKGFTLVTVSQLYDYYGIDLESGKSYSKAEIVEPETTFAVGEYNVKIDSDPTLNLRDNPGMDGAVIAEIPNGTVVNVTEVSGNWAKIAYGEFVGWISTAYLVK